MPAPRNHQRASTPCIGVAGHRARKSQAGFYARLSASCAERYHRSANRPPAARIRPRKNLHNSSNGPLLSLEYYGIMCAVPCGGKAPAANGNENRKQRKKKMANETKEPITDETVFVEMRGPSGNAYNEKPFVMESSLLIMHTFCSSPPFFFS